MARFEGPAPILGRVYGKSRVVPLLFEGTTDSLGSGGEIPLSEFIAAKPPLEFRFPEAALRH